MGKCTSTIRGAPMRNVISRVAFGRRWMETLKCGHTHLSDDIRDHYATFRRCYECKAVKKCRPMTGA